MRLCLYINIYYFLLTAQCTLLVEYSSSFRITPLYFPVFTHAPSVTTINNSFSFPSSFFIIDEYISIDVDLCGEMCSIYLFPGSLNNVMCSYFLFVPFLNLVISFRPSKYKINVG